VVDLAVTSARSLSEAYDVLDDSLATASRIDETESRLAALERQLASRQLSTSLEPPNLSSARLDAQAQLDARGAGPLGNDLVALLDEDAVDQLRRRFTQFAPVRCRLDATDLFVAGMAGLAAGAVDMFVVRIPKNLRWGDAVQRGS